MDGAGALPLPGIVLRQQFADGPARWYAQRGPVVVSGASKVDVLEQLWEQDEAALGAFLSRVAEQPVQVLGRLP